MSFEQWAIDVSNVVEEKLGSRNVATEVYEDHAVWASAKNRGIARPDDDGKSIVVIFDKGMGHRYEFNCAASIAGKEIVGRLLGL